MKDKKKYQGEVERIKVLSLFYFLINILISSQEAVRARNIARRAQQANIARPVRRPGDPVSISNITLSNKHTFLYELFIPGTCFIYIQASNPGLTLGGSGIRRPVVRPDSTSREPAGGIRQWPASQQRQIQVVLGHYASSLFDSSDISSTPGV